MKNYKGLALKLDLDFSDVNEKIAESQIKVNQLKNDIKRIESAKLKNDSDILLALQILNDLTWGPCKSNLMDYDRWTQEIVINGDRFMAYIQLINPLQDKRRIKIASSREFFRIAKAGKTHEI